MAQDSYQIFLIIDQPFPTSTEGHAQARTHTQHVDVIGSLKKAGYSWIEEAIDRPLWRTRFRRRFGPDARRTAE